MPLLPLGLLALQFIDALAQAVDLLALGRPLQRGQDPVRLPVDPLPANPALLRRAGHVAMTAEANDKGTGNPLVGSYHAHGWTSATAASTHTPRHCSCSPLICPPSIVPFVDHLRKCPTGAKSWRCGAIRAAARKHFKPWQSAKVGGAPAEWDAT